MSFRLKGELIKDGDPIKILGELVKTGIRLNRVLIYQYSGGGTSMQNIIMGNFKCNPASYAAHKDLMEIYKQIPLQPDKKCVVFPQAILAQDTISELKSLGIDVGLQFVSPQSGAFSGQISASLAADMGITHAIIHNSEHIYHLGTTLDDDRKRIGACLESGIIPVVCVGETLEEHESGQFENVVSQQIDGLIGNTDFVFHDSVIVYEPLWAIGTGKTVQPIDVQNAHKFIREYFSNKYGAENVDKMKIAFGGSINPATSVQWSIIPNVDGALVCGGALNANIIDIYDNWRVVL